MRALAPNGREIEDTVQIIPATSSIRSGSFAFHQGRIFFEHADETEHHWDDQEHKTNSDGARMFVDSGGHHWPETALTLVEEEDYEGVLFDIQQLVTLANENDLKRVLSMVTDRWF